MKLIVPDYIQSITPYPPGKPVEELQRETGIERTVKLASNENPLGPSPLAIKAILEAVGRVHRYPDGGGYNLVQRLSTHLQVDPQCIVLGNGSDDMISMLTRAFLQKRDEAIAGTPSFLMYEIMVQSAGATLIQVPLKDLAVDLEGFLKKITPKTRMVFICNPNNPTGMAINRKAFEEFLREVPPHVVVVMDEAYIEFVREPSVARGMDYFDGGFPLVELRTFSKAYGLAGLRVGYGVMSKEIAGIIHRVRQPFNVNLLAQLGAAAALEDEAFLKKTVGLTHDGLDFLYKELDKLGITYFPTQTNFFLIDLKKDADAVFEDLLKHGIIVRSMSPYDYPTTIRVNVGLPEENRLFIEALKRVLA